MDGLRPGLLGDCRPAVLGRQHLRHRPARTQLRLCRLEHDDGDCVDPPDPGETGTGESTGGEDDSTATTGGEDDSTATSGGGDDNTATSGGGDDNAATSGGGDDNAATSGGEDDNAATSGGGDDSAATSGGGDDNAATSDGSGTTTGGGGTTDGAGGTTAGGGTTGGGTTTGDGSTTGGSGTTTDGGSTSGDGGISTGGGSGADGAVVPADAVACTTRETFKWFSADPSGVEEEYLPPLSGYNDCSDRCVPEVFYFGYPGLLGDGTCDDGTEIPGSLFSVVDFNCRLWSYDDGDCPDGGGSSGGGGIVVPGGTGGGTTGGSTTGAATTGGGTSGGSTSGGATSGGATSGGSTTGGGTSGGTTGGSGGPTYLDGILPASGPGSECIFYYDDDGTAAEDPGTEDCDGRCWELGVGMDYSGLAAYVSDGYCDDGVVGWAAYNLFCPFFEYDGGDCGAVF